MAKMGKGHYLPTVNGSNQSEMLVVDTKLVEVVTPESMVYQGN